MASSEAERKAWRRSCWEAFCNGFCLWKPELTNQQIADRYNELLAHYEAKEASNA